MVPRITPQKIPLCKSLFRLENSKFIELFISDVVKRPHSLTCTHDQAHALSLSLSDTHTNILSFTHTFSLTCTNVSHKLQQKKSHHHLKQTSVARQMCLGCLGKVFKQHCKNQHCEKSPLLIIIMASIDLIFIVCPKRK